MGERDRSWYPDLTHGADFMELSPYSVDETQQLFIYPSGRSGNELELSFTPNSEMISNSDRDAIMVTIEDNLITIGGVSLENEMNFNR